jgi:hypothetical protein
MIGYHCWIKKIVHQVGCKISILYHDARSKIHQIKSEYFSNTIWQVDRVGPSWKPGFYGCRHFHNRVQFPYRDPPPPIEHHFHLVSFTFVNTFPISVYRFSRYIIASCGDQWLAVGISLYCQSYIMKFLLKDGTSEILVFIALGLFTELIPLQFPVC